MTGQQALWSVEIRHMRAFIAVAAEQNFTRAAEQLCMSQPALSRTIAQMEHLLGERLVHRSHQTVTLTSAGTRLLPHARSVVESLRHAVSAARGEVPQLRVGFTWDSCFEEIPLIVQAYEQAGPWAEIELTGLDEPFSGLRDGRCDLEFIRDFEQPDAMRGSLLFREPRVVALPADHVLAGKPEIDAEDIRYETSVVAIGDHPRVDLSAFVPGNVDVVKVQNIDEWLIAIAAGRGIALVGKSVADFHRHPQIHIATLRNSPSTSLHVAWLNAGRSEESDLLVRLALKLTRPRRAGAAAA